jgi:hypothetical protein
MCYHVKARRIFKGLHVHVRNVGFLCHLLENEVRVVPELKHKQDSCMRDMFLDCVSAVPSTCLQIKVEFFFL